MMVKMLILLCVICFIFTSSGFVEAGVIPKPPEDCKDYNAMDFLMCLSHCSLYHKPCEAYPKAVCRTRPGKCNTCEVYYEYNYEEVECNPRKKFKVCPLNRPALDCGDPCKATVCKRFESEGYECRFSNCGECKTEYNVGQNTWEPCPETQSALNPSVHATHKNNCPSGKAPLTCSLYNCEQSTCRSHPSAKCIPDSCNNCKAEYFVFGISHHAIKVDCQSTACPKDAVEVSCPKDLCTFMPCPNYPKARCVVDNCTQCHVDFVLPNGRVIDKDNCFNRPRCPTQRDTSCHKDVCKASFCPGNMAIWCRMNDCGGCKAEWYNSTTGEVISCPYFDRLLNKAHTREQPHTREETLAHETTNTNEENTITESTSGVHEQGVSEQIPAKSSKPEGKATLEKTLNLLYQLIDILKKEVIQQKALTKAHKHETNTVTEKKKSPNQNTVKKLKKDKKPKANLQHKPKPKQKSRNLKPKPKPKPKPETKKPRIKPDHRKVGGVPVGFKKFDFFNENSAKIEG